MSQLLKKLDYSILQQCMHCGMCLPTCPTYDTTKLERNSPRGRISLMRAIADDRLPVSQEFGREMYYCLGCLACETACPAGVDYTHLFETARAEIEQSGVLDHPQRKLIRTMTLRWLFMRPKLLREVGRLLRGYEKSGLQGLIRRTGLLNVLSEKFRNLEKQTPTISPQFSDELIAPVEYSGKNRYRVGLLTGCVQDIVFSAINRDTASVLLQHGCLVVTPRNQFCCGSLHVHNGEPELAKELAQRNIDSFDLDDLDAIITNAAGCGSHLKRYDELLKEDVRYADRAKKWSEKVRDIHEWLVEIGLQVPPTPAGSIKDPILTTYHEACHLCHGQKITDQPRQVLKSIPGLKLVELPEATWCCGSAGVYNITQPATAAHLQERKIRHLLSTKAEIVATANPGCLLQLLNGLREKGAHIRVAHPISLLAEAYANGGEEV